MPSNVLVIFSPRGLHLIAAVPLTTGDVPVPTALVVALDGANVHPSQAQFLADERPQIAGDRFGIQILRKHGIAELRRDEHADKLGIFTLPTGANSFLVIDHLPRSTT